VPLTSLSAPGSVTHRSIVARNIQVLCAQVTVYQQVMKATHAGHVRTGATCAVLYTSKLLTTGFEHVATTSSTHSQILSDRQKSLHCNVCDHCRQPATGRSLFYCQSFSDLTISKDNFRLNISLRMHTVLTHRSTTEAISSSEWTQQKEREEQFGGDNTTRSRFTAQSW